MAEHTEQRPSWVWTIGPGDSVSYAGHDRRVTALKLDGVAAPYFRLEGTDGGLISYQQVEPKHDQPLRGDKVGGRRS